MRRLAIYCIFGLLITAAGSGASTLRIQAGAARNASSQRYQVRLSSQRGPAGLKVSRTARGARNGATVKKRKARGLLFGNPHIEPRVDKSASGTARAFRFINRTSGQISTIAVYLDSRDRATHVFAVVYASHKNKPGNRLTWGSISSAKAGTWNTIRTKRASVRSGKTYWLAVLGKGGVLRFRDRRGDSCRSPSSRRSNLAKPPFAWKSGRQWHSCQISAYAKGKAKTAKPPVPPTDGPPGNGDGGGGTAGPPPVGPKRPNCTTTVSSMSAVSAAVAQAPGGAVICIAPGSYTGLSLAGAHSQDVTIESEPSLDPNGAGKVTIGLSSTLTDGFGNAVAANIAPDSRHIVLLDLYFTNELSIAYGSSFITVDQNDFSQVGNGGGMMINFATSDCTVPNAPTWSGCQPLAPVSDVTIAGNDLHGITSQGADVLHTNNFRNLHVVANEISGAVENGNHVDCLQNVFGGNGLTFDHNYEHDNECQGFFLKDGDVTNVAFDENLFVRDALPAVMGGSSFSLSQVINTTNFVAEHNTIWDTKGLVLRCLSSSVPCTAAIDHNLLSSLDNGNSGDIAFFNLSESHNIFAGIPFTFMPSSTDQVHPKPAFACGSICGNGTVAGDDYRLTTNPAGIGIDWAPSQYSYGPVG